MFPGTIAIWSGAIVDIPNGYVLCDGNNGTPDLRSRMIEGAGGALNPGDVGGSDSQVHTFTGDGHTHPEAGMDVLAAAENLKRDIGSTQVTGTTDAADNRPAFYALAYIMKV